MAMRTTFTALVGCELPIQVAPMSGITTPSLAAAVIGAGGHAMIGAAGLGADDLSPILDEMEEKAGRAYGINFLIPYLEPEPLELAAKRAPLIDFYMGDPDSSLVETVHAGGALAAWQVSSLEEAVAVEQAGCDLIIAHGLEAGGRNPSRIGLFPLLAQVLDAVTVPVVAAGGIGSARGVAAALAAGAAGVRLGTRFVAAEESGAHPRYVEELIRAGADDTVITEAFSVMWPSGPPSHRVLRSALKAAEGFQGEVVGELRDGSKLVPLPRFLVSPPNKNVTGAVEAMALYAGESVGVVTKVQPAAEIVAELMDGAKHLLREANEATMATS
jgi:nitronate monooxygenase